MGIYTKKEDGIFEKDIVIKEAVNVPYMMKQMENHLAEAKKIAEILKTLTDDGHNIGVDTKMINEAIK